MYFRFGIDKPNVPKLNAWNGTFVATSEWILFGYLTSYTMNIYCILEISVFCKSDRLPLFSSV